MATAKTTSTKKAGKKAAEAKTEQHPGVATITLADVLTATDSEQGFLWVGKENESFVHQNEGHQFIQVHPSMVGDNGEVAVRITDQGRAYLAAEQSGNANENISQNGVDNGAAAHVQSASTVADTNQAAATQVTNQTKGNQMSFAIVKGLSLPSVARGRGASSKYPVDAMEAGDAFFVPNSAFEGGNAAKSLASTVTAANNKYSEVVPGETRTLTKGKNKGQSVPATKQVREYAVRAATHEGTEGAFVFRIK